VVSLLIAPCRTGKVAFFMLPISWEFNRGGFPSWSTRCDHLSPVVIRQLHPDIHVRKRVVLWITQALFLLFKHSVLHMTSRRLQLMWFNSIRNVHMRWRHEIKVAVTPVYGPTLYRLSINLGMGSDANRFDSPRVRTRMEQVTLLLLWKFPWQAKVGVARTSCAIWQSLQRSRVPVSCWLRKTAMFQV
jgi:hypothetical protein